jgi:hypothetical protein
VFLLACLYADNWRGRSPRATATALRRVGADVVVLVNCTRASGNRIRRESRYRYLESITTSSGGIICLADRRLQGAPLSNPDGAAFTVGFDHGETAVIGIAEQPVELGRALANVGSEHPTVLVGHYREDLGAMESVRLLGAHLAVEARTHVQSLDPGRHFGIVVSGLRVHGDGVYVTGESPPVHWARLSA